MTLHWRHYFIEAWGLGTIMFVAGAAAVAVHALPGSAHDLVARHAIAGRFIFGCTVGLATCAVAYSPWGARSGSHFNPALTLAFTWLKKVDWHDALGYVAAQFAGAAIGFAIISELAGRRLLAPPVHGIVTEPGGTGPVGAFAAEFAASFILMTTVLALSNGPPKVRRFTGLAASALIAVFITIEAPLSGTSLNPARSFSSALQEHDWAFLWLYCVAPPVGMLSAAFAFVRLLGADAVRCAKIHHAGPHPCIFHCEHED